MDPTFLIIIILMFVAMYFFSVRPRKKKEKEEAAMRNSVDIGDKIITIGGVFGVVIGVKDNDEEVVIETGGDKTRLRVKRWAIQTRIPLEISEEDLEEYADLPDPDEEEEKTKKSKKKK